MKLNITIFLISIGLFFAAPKEYSWNFCILNTILFFIATSISIIKIKKNTAALLFNILFLFSYFLTAFAYPTFIHPFNINYFTFFFDYSYINKGTALALVGICAYLLGLVRYYGKEECILQGIEGKGPNLYSNQHTGIYQFITVALLAVLILLLKRDSNAGLLSIFKSATIVTVGLIIFKNPISRISQTKLTFSYIIFFSILAIFALMFLTIGDRGPFIFIATILLTLFVIRLKPTQMIALALPVVAVGFFLMFIIQQTRNENTITTSSDIIAKSNEIRTKNDDYWRYGFDLINSSRDIYLGLEYIDMYDYQYGSSYKSIALSVIPYLPSLIGATDVISGSSMITKFHRDRYAPQSDGGMGTQMAIDIYMNLGIGGVIVIMYLFGMYLGYCSLKWFNNIYALTGILFLISTAIYITRSNIFLDLRTLAWALLAIYINSAINAKPKYRFRSLT